MLSEEDSLLLVNILSRANMGELKGITLLCQEYYVDLFREKMREQGHEVEIKMDNE